MSLFIIGAPSFISWSTELHAAEFLINKVIPSKASINSMSVGLEKPLIIEDILLQGIDNDGFLYIPRDYRLIFGVKEKHKSPSHMTMHFIVVINFYTSLLYTFSWSHVQVVQTMDLFIFVLLQ